MPLVALIAFFSAGFSVVFEALAVATTLVGAGFCLVATGVALEADLSVFLASTVGCFGFAGTAFRVAAGFAVALFVALDSAETGFEAFEDDLEATASLVALTGVDFEAADGFTDDFAIVVGAGFAFAAAIGLAAIGLAFSAGLAGFTFFAVDFEVAGAFFMGVAFALLAVFFFFVDKGATPEAEVGELANDAVLVSQNPSGARSSVLLSVAVFGPKREGERDPSMLQQGALF